MIDALDILKHPERMDRDTLYELRSIVALYPYFQTARLALLKNLHILSDPAFEEELHRSAIHLTDRRALWTLLHEEVKAKEVVTRLPSAVDATHDYAAYLEKTASAAAQVEGDRMIEIIDAFLAEDSEAIPERTVVEEEMTAEEGQNVTQLIREGKYSQALEIIKQQSLVVPQKNIYFADQIRFLERVVELKTEK